MQPNRTINGTAVDSTKCLPKFAYEINNSLYLNLTNECSNLCHYCFRLKDDFYCGYNLRIPSVPNTTDLIDEIDQFRRYRELVFCGYGEPTYRLGVLKQISKFAKNRHIRTRLVTNGHGNLIHKKNIVPELTGLIDVMSVSLNADNPKKYMEICKPIFGLNTFDSIIEFIRQSVRYLPSVEITTIELPGIDTYKCMELSTELGANFRLRKLNEKD